MALEAAKRGIARSVVPSSPGLWTKHGPPHPYLFGLFDSCELFPKRSQGCDAESHTVELALAA